MQRTNLLFCHLDSVWHADNVTSDILLPFKVVIANLLAKKCFFAHTVDTVFYWKTFELSNATGNKCEPEPSELEI